MLITLVLIAILFILLLIIDFKIGKYNHNQNPRTLPKQETTGDYQLYKNGSALYEDLFQDIANAESQVDVYFFLVDNDYISQNFLQVLKNKAIEGIPVRLCTDRIGGYKLNKKIRQDLKRSGVQFAFSETPGFPYFFYRINRRNHRKITVIDGKIGYIGGFNIGSNYIGGSAKFGDWRDYHLRVTGPVVSAIHGILLDDWYLATGEKIEKHTTTEKGKHKLKVFATDGVELENEFTSIVQSAKNEILIGSPYFVPTEQLQKALKQAIKNGVDLHILIPMKADHPFVKEAGIPFLEELYHHGGHVHFYDDGFYHSKVIMIDGKFADIGTANFDRRSFFLNKEVNTYVYDEVFISDLRRSYFEDVADAVPFDDHWLKRRALSTRINEKIAVFLRPFL
ncbi:cardiolipin synthase [Halobacillus sp. H74]|uniref:cardiolipin synthase n=1 Tax=Halobacillus sp. H74 TaxID=3457436 RepID=UPI003FCD5B40